MQNGGHFVQASILHKSVQYVIIVAHFCSTDVHNISQNEFLAAKLKQIALEMLMKVITTTHLKITLTTGTFWGEIQWN